MGVDKPARVNMFKRLWPGAERGSAVAELDRTTGVRPNKPSAAAVMSVGGDAVRNREDLLLENALLRQQVVILKRSVKRVHQRTPTGGVLVWLTSVGKAGVRHCWSSSRRRSWGGIGRCSPLLAAEVASWGRTSQSSGRDDGADKADGG